MSESQPPPDANISRRGNWEYASSGSSTYSRRVGTEQWTLITPPTSDQPILLTLVRERQEAGAHHWSLLVAREGEAGAVYQVTGDATFMRTNFQQEANPLIADGFEDGLELATLTSEQAEMVGDAAHEEKPPQAENRAAVVEACQGWTVRVIQNLVRRGVVVEGSKLDVVKGLMEDVRTS